MILLLDNFDSFTYNLVDYFGQIGLDCRVLRNNVPLAEVLSEEYAAVVLSPGPSSPPDAGNLMQVIAHYAGKKPMLGICLGHQAIAMHCGGSLQKCNRPTHGKVHQIDVVDSADPLFFGLPANMAVTRYHSLTVGDLPTCLRISSRVAGTSEIMSFYHQNLPIHGLQFHPEAWLTKHGLDILANWAKHYRLNFVR